MQTRCLKEKILTEFCCELVFSSTPSLTEFDSLVFLSANRASENDVPKLEISGRRLEVSGVGGREARQPSDSSEGVPSRAAAPALHTHTPLCLSRLSLRLRSNKWQQLIKHMVSITYRSARARRYTHAQARTTFSLDSLQISPQRCVRHTGFLCV